MCSDYKQKVQKVLDYTGIFLLVFLVIGYALGAATFAKIYLYVACLPFPIFIGEIGLLLCGIFFVVSSILNPFRWNLGALCIFLYGVWGILKVINGYEHGGGLALRNAALFYYPFIALFVYGAFKRQHFEKYLNYKNPLVLITFFGLAIAIITITMGSFARYYMFTFLVVIGWFLRVSPWRWVLLILVVVDLFYSGIFQCVSRAHLLGLIGAFVFLILYFRPKMKFPVWQKITILICLMFMIVGIIIVFSDHNAVKSLVTPHEVATLYRKLQKEIEQKRGSHITQDIPVCVYHKEYCYSPGILQAEQTVIQDNVPVVSDDIQSNDIKKVETDQGSKVYLVIPSNIKNSDVRSASASEDIKERITQPDQERSLGTAYVNILFRYFIWRDMWQEFLKEKPFVMGFGLDHPQRSKSLEMLEWEGPWWEDGWITPHNSFLHIIYRGGIVGILLIIFMFLALINMIKKFSRMRSVPGGILLSVIIFGFISANFLVFLELPYTAIPFWFIFGVILAYSQELKTVR